MLADPGEWHNLAENPQYAHVIADLRRWLPKKDANPVPGNVGIASPGFARPWDGWHR